ncbi:MAG: hypothetical protein H6599_00395 [Flavobacteriales bacterium]|nr:hypothetical protein [Flavobacteriales bacterium]
MKLLPIDYAKPWGTELGVIKVLDNYFDQFIGLNNDIISFLTANGIPNEIDILDFSYLMDGRASLVSHENAFFFNIGYSSSSGDRVYIDNRDLTIFYIAEGDWNLKWYINQNLESLSQVYLEYVRFCRSMGEIVPNAGFLSEFDDNSYNSFISNVRKIDSGIFSHELSFWPVLFDELVSERNSCREEYLR